MQQQSQERLRKEQRHEERLQAEDGEGGKSNSTNAWFWLAVY